MTCDYYYVVTEESRLQWYEFGDLSRAHLNNIDNKYNWTLPFVTA